MKITVNSVQNLKRQYKSFILFLTFSCQNSSYDTEIKPELDKIWSIFCQMYVSYNSNFHVSDRKSHVLASAEYSYNMHFTSNTPYFGQGGVFHPSLDDMASAELAETCIS